MRPISSNGRRVVSSMISLRKRNTGKGIRHVPASRTLRLGYAPAGFSVVGFSPRRQGRMNPASPRSGLRRAAAISATGPASPAPVFAENQTLNARSLLEVTGPNELGSSPNNR